MNKLVEAFTRFAPKYLVQYGDTMPPLHFKALLNFTECRTEQYGLVEDVCPSCGTVEVKRGACRNRACPKCNNSRTEEWIVDAKERLPNVPYYHLVFTIPSELRDVARKNQKVFYENLMRSVGETMVAFGKSTKWVQGQVGFMSVLHTWDSKLLFHPHVHVLMLGGFLNEDGKFVPIERKNVFPARCLAKRFKTVLLKSLRRDLGENIPSRFWKLPFVVHMKKTFPGTSDVVSYLGRYIKRVGIGPSRLETVDKQGVVFRYRHRLNSTQSEFRLMRVSGEEFLRRYLQHVLPRGFVRLRYYGLLHSRQAEVLKKVKQEYEEVKEEKVEEVVPAAECKKCRVKKIPMREVRPWWSQAKKKGWKFYIDKVKREMTARMAKEEDADAARKGGAPPYNNPFNPTEAGRHAFRLRESRAGSAKSLLLRRRDFAPCPAG